MKKRMIAFLCILVLTIAALGSVAEAKEDNAMLVGYARVNITPYVVEGDPSSGVMALPLRGHGDVWNRPSAYLMDDNGDGVIDENDGLFITCIAVTDRNGETVLLYTIDVIGVGDYSAYRSAICERLGKQVEYENIMLAGTHTHGAPDVSVYESKAANVPEGSVTTYAGDTFTYQQMNTDLGIWIQRTYKAAADAAEYAMADRAPVTLRKGELSASQSVAADGRVMNSTRHYWNEASDCVGGDNFNSRGSDPKQVGQVNDNIYMLEFCYEEDSGKENVVLANWRGHPSLNSSSSNQQGRLTVTSDYVNAFRCRIEEEGYRVAFFSGEGGNVNPRGYELDEEGNPAYKWIDAFNKKTGDNNSGNGYGKALGEMGLECLESCMSEVDSTGTIVTRQLIMNAERNLMGLSDLSYDASRYYLDNSISGRYIYTDTETGEKYVIASRHQANSVVGKWDRENSKPSTTTSVGMELNTIQIGKDIAFVTVPGEPFDRYSLQAAEEMDGNLSDKTGNTSAKINAALASANSYNDWLNIRGEVLGTDFGTPFVLGYCNGTVGYIPSAMTYDYNQDSTKWAWGSYETQTARVARGTGERMIQTFADMLTGNVEGSRTAWCEACQEMAEWIPMSSEANMSEAVNGHIYLKEDVEGPQILVQEGRNVCLDLNGHSYTGRTRAIYVYSGHKAAIFDTSAEKTGKLIGRGSENAVSSGFAGSTLLVEADAELSIYGGTITRISEDVVSAKNGGIGIITGRLNIYDGVLTGGRAEADGGSLYVRYNGSLYMYGGRVDDCVAGASANTSCVLTNGRVYLSGDASVAKIRFVAATNSGAPKITNWLTVQDEFTGSAALSFKASVSIGTDVGNAVANAWMDSADITVNGKDWAVVKQNTNLVIAAKTYQAQLISDGVATNYNTLQNALEAASQTDGSYAKLLCEIPATADIRLKKDTYLDLNGLNVKGSVAVADGATLYCMDSVTDDYTIIDDERFGELTGTVTGDVQGVPVNTVSAPESETDSHRAGYLRVNHTGGISFHRVNLQITAMTLRAGDVGVYYKSHFKGDEAVSEEVESFGIALCLFDPPTAENLKVSCGYTVFNAFEPGAQGNASSGTLLKNIMREDLGAAVNDSRGRLPVCGRAYIETSDGYMFGAYVERTLVEQMEGVDAIWNSLSAVQQRKVLTMYKKYEDTMATWYLPNIQDAVLKQNEQ